MVSRRCSSCISYINTCRYTGINYIFSIICFCFYSYFRKKFYSKSIVGYAIAATAAYIVWFVVSKYINEKDDEITDPKRQAFWRNSQWVASGFLWATWLMHDVANIAVYLPRKIDPTLFILVMVYFVILIYYIFWREGGPIQKIVLEKTGTRYARSCTIIDLVYCAVLYFFKELNDLPMSTTWVFVGLLCGRELAIATHHKTNLRKYVFPIIGKDFFKNDIWFSYICWNCSVNTLCNYSKRFSLKIYYFRNKFFFLANFFLMRQRKLLLTIKPTQFFELHLQG